MAPSVVISAPSAPAKTMIVEFPKATCVHSAFKRAKIAAPRQKFLNNCGSGSTSWKKLGGSVTIVGVGFWDEKHGQTGVAPNGTELHPVLNFTGDCHPASGGGGKCSPAYPTVCIPPPRPRLRRYQVHELQGVRSRPSQLRFGRRRDWM